MNTPTPNLVAAPQSAHPGYIVEIAEHGPWLAQDGSVAIEWDQRGIWPTVAEAQACIDGTAPGVIGSGVCDGCHDQQEFVQTMPDGKRLCRGCLEAGGKLPPSL